MPQQRCSNRKVEKERFKELSDIGSLPLKSSLEVRYHESVLIHALHDIGKFEFRHRIISKGTVGTFIRIPLTRQPSCLSRRGEVSSPILGERPDFEFKGPRRF